MRMEFSFIYTTHGIISSTECTEVRTYDSTLEDAETFIKADLSKVFRQMKKGNAYLRVSTGADTWTQTQALCINQSWSDIDNGIYTVTIFSNNSREDRKTSAAQARKYVLEVFRQMVRVEEHTEILST